MEIDCSTKFSSEKNTVSDGQMVGVEIRFTVLKPDFNSPSSFVTRTSFAWDMRRVVKPIEEDEKNIFRSVRIGKFKYFNYCEIFLQRNLSDFFLEPRGHYIRIEKFLQNGRPTALLFLREDIPQYFLKTRISELQTLPAFIFSSL